MPEATLERRVPLLEILPVTLAAGAIRWLRPPHSASWQVACPWGDEPGPVVVAALDAHALRPSVVHSTSWRHHDGRLVLTYLAVLRGDLPGGGGLLALPVQHRALARGGAITAPASLDVDQVLHHALRHLAWLEREDPAVAAELDPGWGPALAMVRPEPFHAPPIELQPAV